MSQRCKTSPAKRVTFKSLKVVDYPAIRLFKVRSNASKVPSASITRRGPPKPSLNQRSVSSVVLAPTIWDRPENQGPTFSWGCDESNDFESLDDRSQLPLCCNTPNGPSRFHCRTSPRSARVTISWRDRPLQTIARSNDVHVNVAGRVSAVWPPTFERRIAR